MEKLKNKTALAVAVANKMHTSKLGYDVFESEYNRAFEEMLNNHGGKFLKLHGKLHNASACRVAENARKAFLDGQIEELL